MQAFLAVQDKNPSKPVSMKGDAVHPGPPGQLMMAAALLKALGADPFVSSATLDASGKLVEAKGCKIENVAVEDSEADCSSSGWTSGSGSPSPRKPAPPSPSTPRRSS